MKLNVFILTNTLISSFYIVSVSYFPVLRKGGWHCSFYIWICKYNRCIRKSNLDTSYQGTDIEKKIIMQTCLSLFPYLSSHNILQLFIGIVIFKQIIQTRAFWQWNYTFLRSTYICDNNLYSTHSSFIESFLKTCFYFFSAVGY